MAASWSASTSGRRILIIFLAAAERRVQPLHASAQALKVITLYAGPVAALRARMVGWQVTADRSPSFDPDFPCTWKQ